MYSKMFRFQESIRNPYQRLNCLPVHGRSAACSLPAGLQSEGSPWSSPDLGSWTSCSACWVWLEKLCRKSFGIRGFRISWFDFLGGIKPVILVLPGLGWRYSWVLDKRSNTDLLVTSTFCFGTEMTEIHLISVLNLWQNNPFFSVQF